MNTTNKEILEAIANLLIEIKDELSSIKHELATLHETIITNLPDQK